MLMRRLKLEIELICELGWNIWQGRKSKQAIIQDFECRKVDEEEILIGTICGKIFVDRLKLM